MHPDHLGIGLVITNQAGATTNWYEYMPLDKFLMVQSNHEYNNPYKYNGKELDEATGLYYYGARYYDPKSSVCLSVDPLAEKMPSWSPYAYAFENPMRFIDPDGRMPAPPRALFINGYLMMGSLKGGRKYWNDSFVNGAIGFGSKTYKDAFNMQTTYVNYNPAGLSSANRRSDEGYAYAQANYTSLTKGMNIKEDYFNIVDHSMGVAFGEGVSKYMQERGWEINKIVHINAFQAADIEVNKQGHHVMSADKPQVIDYQNIDDPVISNPIRSSPGDIKNSTYKVREESGMSRDFKHASPISKGKNFWIELTNKLKK